MNDTTGKLNTWADANLTEPLYIPELADDDEAPLTKQDFIDTAEGDEIVAELLFDCTTWQHPATVWDEGGGMDFFRGTP